MPAFDRSALQRDRADDRLAERDEGEVLAQALVDEQPEAHAQHERDVAERADVDREEQDRGAADEGGGEDAGGRRRAWSCPSGWVAAVAHATRDGPRRRPARGALSSRRRVCPLVARWARLARWSCRAARSPPARGAAGCCAPSGTGRSVLTTSHRELGAGPWGRLPTRRRDLVGCRPCRDGRSCRWTGVQRQVDGRGRAPAARRYVRGGPAGGATRPVRQGRRRRAAGDRSRGTRRRPRGGRVTDSGGTVGHPPADGRRPARRGRERGACEDQAPVGRGQETPVPPRPQ